LPGALVAPVVGSGWMARRAVRWIERQRRTHRAHAAPIDANACGRFAEYFEPSTLDEVRLRIVTRYAGPRSLSLFGRFLPFTIDFDRVYGITFVDTIVIAQELVPETDRLACLFHECVHVAQYRLLGVGEFVRRYLAAWAAVDWIYGAIPLERDAYELQRRFAANPMEPFSVEAEVTRRLEP